MILLKIYRLHLLLLEEHFLHFKICFDSERSLSPVDTSIFYSDLVRELGASRSNQINRKNIEKMSAWQSKSCFILFNFTDDVDVLTSDFKNTKYLLLL